MKIFENTIIDELNTEKYFLDTSVDLSLEYAKTFTDKYDDFTNFFLYWIGDNLNYKHSVVIKSYLTSQNLERTKLIIYSDVDITNNQYMKQFDNNKNIEFRIIDLDKETKDTILENHRFNNYITSHVLNPALESDYIRLLLLHNYGGVYIDFDVLLIRDLSPLLKYEFMYQWQSYPKINQINGAVMRINKNSKLSNDLLLELSNTVPSNRSLCWASDLYCKVKEYNKNWLVFPSAFFNTEWQLNRPIKPFEVDEYSNELFDGCFSWHWHNRWNDDIKTNSKFDIIDKKIQIKYDNM